MSTPGDGQSNEGDGAPPSTNATVTGKRKQYAPRSDAWKHFTKFQDTRGKNKAKCNYCGREYSCNFNKCGTTNLNNHLTGCTQMPRSSNSQNNLSSTIDDETGEAKVNLVSWKFDQQACRQAIAKMIMIDELPFKFVENEGFRNCMRKCQPLLFGEANEMKSELDRYLKEDIEEDKDYMNSTEFNVLDWWKKRSPYFPILSLIARDILAIPISTVASESTFSTGGRVLDSFRSSLNPATVQALICCQDWICSSNKANVEESIENTDELEEDLRKSFKESTVIDV